MKSQKGNAPLIIIVILFIIAIAVTYWKRDKNPTPSAVSVTAAPSPTSYPSPTILPTPTGEIDPKTGWKIYKNKDFNYSVEYPVEYDLKIWDVKGHQVMKYYLSFIHSKYRGQSQPPEISITVNSNPQSMPLKDWLNKHTKSDATERYEQISNLESVIIDGNSALKYRDDSRTWGISSFGVLIPKETIIYGISYTNAHSKEDIGATFNQILSTFKFNN